MTNLVKLKPSIFNIETKKGDMVYFFNSVSGEMMGFREKRAHFFRHFLAKMQNDDVYRGDVLADRLAMMGFVVDEQIDEYRREEKRFNELKRGDRVLRVTIAPTMACNMNCNCCFQGMKSEQATMTPQMRNGVVRFVESMSKEAEVLSVQWIGGEPLLVFDKVYEMSMAFKQLCEQRGMRYRAELLTNATLLSERSISALKEISVKSIQIPLDGSVDIYAERRHIPRLIASGFLRFLYENLQRLLEAIGSVTIRINIDRENLDEAKEVVWEIKSRNCIDPRVDFRLGFFDNAQGTVDCIPHECMTPNEFSEIETDFKYFLMNEGFRVFGGPIHQMQSCSASLKNAFTIDPLGRIGKCVPAIGTGVTQFAQIYPDDLDRTIREVGEHRVPYEDFNPFISGSCRECELLPVCLGSCPKIHESGREVTHCLKGSIEKWLPFYREYYEYEKTKRSRGKVTHGLP